ncbi:MAG TPA: acetyl-CoA carboxylase biotin carboxyl carrier protein [Capillimicrobium sp.]|nr:acetyl-CoA carboxylase biotin carboxyl carrier protein [Capillimicrobium sp.]
MALTDDDVREILRIIDETQLDELRLDTDGFSLHVRRGGAPGSAPASVPAPAAAPSPPAASAPAAAEPAATPAPATAAADSDHHEVVSPMLGTFYRAEAPGRPPFVEVGDQVEPDTVVCLIEVMKMMNSIQAGVAGTIVEVCAENAELVEPGAVLFRVEPAS